MQAAVKILLVISSLFLSAYGIQTYLDGYETRTVSVEVPYQEPIYKQLYSGTLMDYGVCLFSKCYVFASYPFKDATSITFEKTQIGKDMAGNDEYNARICWDSYCKDDLGINDAVDFIQYPSQIVIGNETKYRIESREVTKKRRDWLFS